jgi:TrpR-related protein YerC/YecD
VLYLTKVIRNNWDNQKTMDLTEAVLSLKTANEMKKFLRDLLTEQELVEFGNRWRAANMLNENIPYSKIEKETGLSSTTIARISKWLKQGMGGYKIVLKRLGKDRVHHSLNKKVRGMVSAEKFHRP